MHMNGSQVAGAFLCMCLVCLPIVCSLEPKEKISSKISPDMTRLHVYKNTCKPSWSPGVPLLCLVRTQRITQSDIIRLRIYFEAKRQLCPHPTFYESDRFTSDSRSAPATVAPSQESERPRGAAVI